MIIPYLLMAGILFLVSALIGRVIVKGQCSEEVDIKIIFLFSYTVAFLLGVFSTIKAFS